MDELKKLLIIPKRGLPNTATTVRATKRKPKRYEHNQRRNPIHPRRRTTWRSVRPTRKQKAASSASPECRMENSKGVDKE